MIPLSVLNIFVALSLFILCCCENDKVPPNSTVSSLPLLPWKSVAVTFDGRCQFVAASGAEIYGSCDGGSTWNVTAPAANWVSICVNSAGSFLVAAQHCGYVYVSYDSGTSWTTCSPFACWKAVACTVSGDIVTAVADNDFLYVYQPYVSIQWMPISLASSTSWKGVAVGDFGNYIIAVDAATTYVVMDLGARFFIFPQSDFEWQDVACSRNCSDIIITSNGAQAMRTSNPQNSWPYYPQLASTYLAVTCDGTGIFVAAVSKTNTPTSSGGSIYLSHDYGKQWIMVDNLEHNWNDISTDGSGQHLAAITSDGGYYTSSDSGVSWQYRVEACYPGFGFNGSDCVISCITIGSYNNGSSLTCLPCPPDTYSIGTTCSSSCSAGTGYDGSKGCTVQCLDQKLYNNGSFAYCQPCPNNTVSTGSSCAAVCPSGYGYHNGSCDLPCNSDMRQYNNGSFLHCHTCPISTVSNTLGTSCLTTCPAGQGSNGWNCSVMCRQEGLFNDGSYLTCQACPSAMVSSEGVACISTCPATMGYIAAPTSSCADYCVNHGPAIGSSYNNGSYLYCQPCPGDTVSLRASCTLACPAGTGYAMPADSCSTRCQTQNTWNDGSLLVCATCPPDTVVNAVGTACRNPCAYPYVPTDIQALPQPFDGSQPLPPDYRCQVIALQFPRWAVVLLTVAILIVYTLANVSFGSNETKPAHMVITVEIVAAWILLFVSPLAEVTVRLLFLLTQHISHVSIFIMLILILFVSPLISVYHRVSFLHSQQTCISSAVKATPFDIYVLLLPRLRPSMPQWSIFEELDNLVKVMLYLITWAIIGVLNLLWMIPAIFVLWVLSASKLFAIIPALEEVWWTLWTDVHRPVQHVSLTTLPLPSGGITDLQSYHRRLVVWLGASLVLEYLPQLMLVELNTTLTSSVRNSYSDIALCSIVFCVVLAAVSILVLFAYYSQDGSDDSDSSAVRSSMRSLLLQLWRYQSTSLPASALEQLSQFMSGSIERSSMHKDVEAKESAVQEEGEDDEACLVQSAVNSSWVAASLSRASFEQDGALA